MKKHLYAILLFCSLLAACTNVEHPWSQKRGKTATVVINARDICLDEGYEPSVLNQFRWKPEDPPKKIDVRGIKPGPEPLHMDKRDKPEKYHGTPPYTGATVGYAGN